MKKHISVILLFMFITVLCCSLAGCSTKQSLVYEMDNGDTIKVKFDSSDGYHLEDNNGTLSIIRDDSSLSQGVFSNWSDYELYNEAVSNDTNAEILEEGITEDGHAYFFYKFHNEDAGFYEHNYIIQLSGSNSCLILGNAISEASAHECFSRLQIIVESTSADPAVSTVPGTGSAENAPAATDAEQQPGYETQSQGAGSPSVEEQEIYNKDGISILVTGMTFDMFGGGEINFIISNQTEQNIVVQSELVCANGWMLPVSGLYSDVPAGQERMAKMYLEGFELLECNIMNLGDISFNLGITDKETYADIDYSDRITLVTSEAGKFTQEYDESGLEVYNDNGIRLIYKGIVANSQWDSEIIFFAQNTTDQTVLLTAEDVSVNGLLLSDVMYCDMLPGTWVVGRVYIDMTDANLTDIAEITEVMCKVSAMDADLNAEINSQIITISLF